MMHRYAAITAIGLSALVMGFASLTAAQELGGGDTMTHMTFTDAVRVADVTLPAGSYVFRLNESHDAVWIIGEDNGAVFGPFLTRPTRRLRWDSSRAIVVDRAADASGVPALRAWFGRNGAHGYELVPRTQSGN